MNRLACTLVLLIAGCQKQAPVPAAEPVEPPPAEATAPPVAASSPPRLDLKHLEPVPGDAAVLAFGWEDGWEANVQHEVVAKQILGDMMVSKTTTTGTWVEQFVGSKDGHRYRQMDGAGETRIEPPPAGAEVMGQVMTLLTLAAPEVVVTEEGAFSGIDDLDGMKSSVAGQVAPLIERLPPAMRDPLHMTLEQGLAEDAVTADAARRWQSIVGDWIGQTLEVGEASERTDDAGHVITTTLLGWVPCKTDLTTPECAVVERRIDASPAEVERSRERVQLAVAGSLPMGENAPELGISEVFTLELLVVEPATLRPWGYTRRKAESHAYDVGERPTVFGSELRTSTWWSWHTMGRP